MVATETLGQTGGWGRRRKLWMWGGGSPQVPQGLLGVAGVGGSSPRGKKVRGVFGGWVSCMVLLSGGKGGPAW